MTSSSTVGTDPHVEMIDKLSYALGLIEGRAMAAIARAEIADVIADSHAALVAELVAIRDIARSAFGGVS